MVKLDRFYCTKVEKKATLKIRVPTKLFITQNDRNHYALGMAVLGGELSLPCFTTDVRLEGFEEVEIARSKIWTVRSMGNNTPLEFCDCFLCFQRVWGVSEQNFCRVELS